jgi:hypothetical protein
LRPAHVFKDLAIVNVTALEKNSLARVIHHARERSHSMIVDSLMTAKLMQDCGLSQPIRDGHI